MAEMKNASVEASPEQIAYAKLLEKGMIIGLLLLIVTFIIYATGIIKPFIPKTEISQYWSQSVDEYLHMADVHAGWSWLGMLGYSDFLNFVPIAMLAGVTIVCYLFIVPTLWRKNDKVYAVLCLLEAAILTIAASGLLGSGGH
jgi:hypothetical protein